MFSMDAIYKLSLDITEEAYPNERDPYKITAVKHLAKQAVQELEACSERLSGDRLGYFEGQFGTI